MAQINFCNKNKFKKILLILAERETNTTSANFLYNALTYPRTNFDTFAQSLLHNGLSPKQFIIAKMNYLFAPQQSHENLSEYLDNQIILLRLFGENNESSNIQHLKSSIHPNYLLLLGYLEGVQTYIQLYNKVKEVEIRLNENLSTHNRPTYAQVVRNHSPNFKDSPVNMHYNHYSYTPVILHIH